MSSHESHAHPAPSRPASLGEVFLRRFSKLAAVQPGERVLDIAVGGPEAAVDGAARSGELGEALVIAPDLEALERVTARARALHIEPPPARVMDPARLDQPDSYWDVVTCHFGLSALEDVDATLKEILRVLRPVGRAGFSALGSRERCPLYTFFADAVATSVPAVRAEMQRLFRFAEPGLLARTLADAGFQDAVPDRETEWIVFQDVDDYWQFMIDTTTVGKLAAHLPHDVVAEAKREIDRKLKFYRRKDGIELKVEALALAAVK